MQDIPVFATEYGVGSLVLRDVPSRGVAYIRIHDASDPEGFLKECTGFCEAVGAEHIYATGHNYLEQRPLYTSVVAMERQLANLPNADVNVCCVTKQTAQKWRDIYNIRMKEVSTAAYMSSADMDVLVNSGTGYFVYRDTELLGIGIASGERLEALATVVPGTGRDVLLALCGMLNGDKACLEVATNNIRAVRLYERMGFATVAEVSRWYEIL